jgi:short-subunit dehydrogenase
VARGKGATAMVTGASSGIGEALSIELARRGYSVGLIARREEVLKDLSSRLTALAPANRFPLRAVDLTDAQALRDGLDQLWEELGGVDLFIANAGTGLLTPVLSRTSEQAVQEVLMLNVLGTVLSLEHVKNRMLERGGGHLVGISSLGDERGLPARSAYCASKAAVTTYLEALAVALPPRGIAVTVVRPGYVRNACTRPNAPFVMEPEFAARIILNGLERRGFEISFPTPTATVMGILSRLPRRFYFGLARRMAARRLAPDFMSPTGE